MLWEFSLLLFFKSLQQSFRQSKKKAFADDKIWVSEIFEIHVGKGRKHCGNRGKCWLPKFSPFSTMFSTVFFYKVDPMWLSGKVFDS